MAAALFLWPVSVRQHTSRSSRRFQSAVRLVQFGVNTTTEIWRFYLWHELYEDFCRDSLAQSGYLENRAVTNRTYDCRSNFLNFIMRLSVRGRQAQQTYRISSTILESSAIHGAQSASQSIVRKAPCPAVAPANDITGGGIEPASASCLSKIQRPLCHACSAPVTILADNS